MKRSAIALIGLGAAMLAAGALAATTPAPAPAKPAPARAAAPAMSARQLVDRAAASIGGADKLRAIRNLTLIGYGQYAYMNGGGRISGQPEAPEKLQAANELSRVYDLEHGRFQMKERRNMLFPFLDTFGHSWAPQNQILDGDLAFNVNPEGPAARIARWSDNDGVHMRRLWMLNNPVVLVRTLMDPATKLSAPRREGALSVVDVTLKEGDKLAVGFEAGGLPGFIRWANPQTNLGQNTLTTWWTGWSDIGDGVLAPLGYQTRLDWRNVDFFKMYVDAYRVNTQIADLAAPAAVRAASEPVSYPVPAITSVQIARGLWRITNGGTTVVEFKDHVLIFELGVNVQTSKAVLNYIRTQLVPGKPIKYLVASHNHFDHTAGLRQAVAEGITVIQRPNSGLQFKSATEHAAPEFPDELAKSGRKLKFMPMGEHLRLQDETRTLDLYWGRNNGHMADVVFGYVPEEKLMMEGDLVTAAFTWQHWADTFRDVVKAYNLDVQRISPVHSVWREHPDILTREQGEEIMAGGTKRAREHCNDYLSKGIYAPGCPVQSKYY